MYKSLHVGTQFHGIYQEQLEAFHPSSKHVIPYLGVHKAGWFFIKEDSKIPTNEVVLVLVNNKRKREIWFPAL